MHRPALVSAASTCSPGNCVSCQHVCAFTEAHTQHTQHIAVERYETQPGSCTSRHKTCVQWHACTASLVQYSVQHRRSHLQHQHCHKAERRHICSSHSTHNAWTDMPRPNHPSASPMQTRIAPCSAPCNAQSVVNRSGRPPATGQHSHTCNPVHIFITTCSQGYRRCLSTVHLTQVQTRNRADQTQPPSDHPHLTNTTHH
jgi:hypothetical protein